MIRVAPCTQGAGAGGGAGAGAMYPPRGIMLGLEEEKLEERFSEERRGEREDALLRLREVRVS